MRAKALGGKSNSLFAGFAVKVAQHAGVDVPVTAP